MSTPDFYSMHARKLLGMPQEWRWFRLQAKDGGAGRRFTEITGAIPAGVITKGPRKGDWRWKGRTQEREVLIGDEEHQRFCEEWERETGSCMKCGGTRQQSWGWSQEEGQRWRTCPRCAKRPAVMLVDKQGVPVPTPEAAQESA